MPQMSLRALVYWLGARACGPLLGWLALVWNSGTSMPQDERFAVLPGAFTDDEPENQIERSPL